jgi:hypothetical protein
VVSRFCESIARKQLVALFGLYLKVGREWWFGMLRGRHVVVVVVLAAVECIDYYYYQQEDFQVMAPVHARRRYFDSLEPEQRLVLRTVALRQVELMCILKGAFGRVERRTSTRESRSNCS